MLPLAKDDFDLSPREFGDGLAIRYLKPLQEIPPKCHECGTLVTVNHALDCRKHGLVVQRRNEVQDTINDLAAMAWSHADSEWTGHQNVARESFRSVTQGRYWSERSMANTDNGVVWCACDRHWRQVLCSVTRIPQLVLENAEKEKKIKYAGACEEKHVSFTPLCFSVDGLIGNEAKIFLKRLADQLANKWHKPYGTIMYWLKAKLNFALIRATVLCVRGTRSRLRSAALLDGASIKSAYFADLWFLLTVRLFLYACHCLLVVALYFLVFVACGCLCCLFAYYNNNNNNCSGCNIYRKHSSSDSV